MCILIPSSASHNLNVTEIQVADYIFCPLRYKFLYVDYIEEMPSPYTRFENAVRAMAIHFFFYTMDGHFPTLTNMKECVERMWYTEDHTDIQERLMWREFNLVRKLENKIFDGILRFYERETAKGFRTLMVEQHYELPVGDHILEGCLDVIREIDKKVEVVTIRPAISPYAVNFDTGLTAASYAFRNLYGVKEDILTAYFVPSVREVNTKRRRDNYRGLVGLIDYLAGSPSYYPRYNDKCYMCSYREKCGLWPTG